MPEAKNVIKTKTSPEESFKKPTILNTSYSSSDSTPVSPHLNFTFQIQHQKQQDNTTIPYQPPKTTIEYVKNTSFKPHHNQYPIKVDDNVTNNNDVRKYNPSNLPEPFYSVNNNHYRIIKQQQQQQPSINYMTHLNGNNNHRSQLPDSISNSVNDQYRIKQQSPVNYIAHLNGNGNHRSQLQTSISSPVNDQYRVKQQSPVRYITHLNGTINHGSHIQTSISSPAGPKKRPAVGTLEWLKLRRENHKQVERKRREGINDTIKHLSVLVPGAEKHKGGILNRVVDYINKQQNEFERLNHEHHQEVVLLKSHINKLTFELDRIPNPAKSVYTNENLNNSYVNQEEELKKLRAEISELKAHLKQTYTSYDTLDKRQF